MYLSAFSTRKKTIKERIYIRDKKMQRNYGRCFICLVGCCFSSSMYTVSDGLSVVTTWLSLRVEHSACFLFFPCACVCMYACMCLCIRVHVCVYPCVPMCVCVHGTILHHPPHSLRQGLSIKPRAHWSGWSASHLPLWSPVSSSQGWNFGRAITPPSIYVDSGALDSSSHACMPSTVTTEPSLQIPSSFF